MQDEQVGEDSDDEENVAKYEVEDVISVLQTCIRRDSLLDEFTELDDDGNVKMRSNPLSPVQNLPVGAGAGTTSGAETSNKELLGLIETLLDNTSDVVVGSDNEFEQDSLDAGNPDEEIMEEDCLMWDDDFGSALGTAPATAAAIPARGDSRAYVICADAKVEETDDTAALYKDVVREILGDNMQDGGLQSEEYDGLKV